MKRWAVRTLLLALAWPVFASAGEFGGLTMRGPTGLVLAPAPAVLRGDWFGAGITGGVAKAAYGLFGLGEAGIVTPDLLARPGKAEWIRDLALFGKAGGLALPGVWSSPAAAAGGSVQAFASGADEGRLTLSTSPSGYVCASLSPALAGWIVELVGGWGNGVYQRRAFGGVGVLPPGLFNRSIKFIADYAGEEAAVGGRIALSRNLRLDAFVLSRAQPPGGAGGRRGWLIVAERGLPGASWTGPAGLAGLLGFRPRVPRPPPP